MAKRKTAAKVVPISRDVAIENALVEAFRAKMAELRKVLLAGDPAYPQSPRGQFDVEGSITFLAGTHQVRVGFRMTVKAPE